MGGTGFWGRFALDPRVPEHAPLRAADRDRDVVHELLAASYADGRLTREEHDERSEQAAAARTLGELPALVTDLVPASPGRAGPPDRRIRAEAELRYRQRRQRALVAFLTPTLVCWVVWLSLLLGEAGPEFPWPAIVTIVTGMRFAQLAVSREDSISAIERHLERRELRRQQARRRLQGWASQFPPPPAPLRPGRGPGQGGVGDGVGGERKGDGRLNRG